MDTQKYILKSTGEEVAEESWGWGVVYNDDTTLYQFDEEKKEFHQLGEIDQDRVKLFVMYKISEPSKRIDLVFPKNARLIHRYRNIKPYYKDDFVKVYLFGYKKGDQYCYNFILPDDRMVMSDKDDVNLETFNL